MTDAAIGTPHGAPTVDEGLREGEMPLTAADGTPLKKRLARALRREKIRALMLIAPLLAFILVTFIAPIADMLFRSVENQIVSDTLPRTTAALSDWDGVGIPSDDALSVFAQDLVIAAER
jgi:putative spermidine/putrescine transport system permease protein